jgi:hypothetical protein
MDAFFNDLKHSLRTFLRNPGFTLTALAALTLGIGTNTAIFSVVNRVLLKPVAAPDPDKITGILFGLIPALQASRIDISSMPRKTKARAFLVVSEVSLALVLLIGSGLLIRSFLSMRSIEPGFDTHNVLTLQISLTGDQYRKTAGLARLVDASVERIRALPGVESAASGCCLPIGSVPNAPFVIAGRPLNGTFHARAGMPVISADYFDVFKIPIVRGRKFTRRDGPGAPLVYRFIKQYPDLPGSGHRSSSSGEPRVRR